MSSVATRPYTTSNGVYINPAASAYTCTYTDSRSTCPASSSEPTDPVKIKAFHESLPNFNKTALYALPQIAQQFDISRFLIKAESQRLGLPAFKILGASWGVYRSLCLHFELCPDPGVTSFESLKGHIARHWGHERGEHGVGEGQGQRARVVLFAATDGNHGRAVARMAGLLGLSPSYAHEEGEAGCVIYVPHGMYDSTRRLIESEGGAEVVTVNGDYDFAVAQCWAACQRLQGQSGGERVGVMVQDNGFDGYEVVPRWIVEGYSTLLREVDEQFADLLETDVTEVEGDEKRGKQITHVVTPIGVGSLGHAVVNWAKSAGRKKIRVIAVEPETAGCLHESLKAAESKTIGTVDTIMSGMCCGTVSPTSWPVLRDGVDFSVTVDDWTCHETVLELQGLGIEAGPCGAGCLAGLRKLLGDVEARERLGLGEDSVIVLLSTEGRREYPVPEKR